jgi:hypothetical protein
MLRAEQLASAKGAFKAGRGRESVALAWHGLRIHICAPRGGQGESSALRGARKRPSVFGFLVRISACKFYGLEKEDSQGRFSPLCTQELT